MAAGKNDALRLRKKSTSQIKEHAKYIADLQQLWDWTLIQKTYQQAQVCLLDM